MSAPAVRPTPAGRAPWSAAVRRHPLVAFFFLAFALTWAIMVPLVIASHGLVPFPDARTAACRDGLRARLRRGARDRRPGRPRRRPGAARAAPHLARRLGLVGRRPVPERRRRPGGARPVRPPGESGAPVPRPDAGPGCGTSSSPSWSWGWSTARSSAGGASPRPACWRAPAWRAASRCWAPSWPSSTCPSSSATAPRPRAARTARPSRPSWPARCCSRSCSPGCTSTPAAACSSPPCSTRR